MKIGLFFIIILVALLHPKIPFAQEVKGFQNFGLLQQELRIQKISTGTFNLYCDDDQADINDDEISLTERRNLSFHKSIYRTNFFLLSQSHKDSLKNAWNLTFVTHLQASLFILNRVLII